MLQRKARAAITLPSYKTVVMAATLGPLDCILISPWKNLDPKGWALSPHLIPAPDGGNPLAPAGPPMGKPSGGSTGDRIGSNVDFEITLTAVQECIVTRRSRETSWEMDRGSGEERKMVVSLQRRNGFHF